jgi:hypothetical protein
MAMLVANYPDHDTKGFNGFDFIHAFGSGRGALMYSQLFWPEFAEFQGMVVLKESLETSEDKNRIDAALKREMDKSQVEQSFNLIEISYLFGRRSGDTDINQDRLLAEILCEMWSCRLHSLFPTRLFRVEIVPPESVDDAVAITFFQRS